MTFCYFPISFRPPPNDPYGITADDLKLALRKCMASSPHFAKMAIPLFLEKFPTSAGPAMKDLMLTIGECLPVYGAVAVDERGKEVWECVKTEASACSRQTFKAQASDSILFRHNYRSVCPICPRISHTDPLPHSPGYPIRTSANDYQGVLGHDARARENPSFSRDQDAGGVGPRFV